MAIAVGIDVGGPNKGFHAVALDGDRVLKTHSLDTEEIVNWCSSIGARAIAIDAPAGWRTGSGLRLAERELQERGLHFFATPNKGKSSSPFYNWMHNGFGLYELLARRFPRIGKASTRISGPVCFESFPHAIAHALCGGRTLEGSKVKVRRRLLAERGISVEELTNVDYVDAGLCAYAAQRFLANDAHFLGDLAGGFLVLPGETSQTPMLTESDVIEAVCDQLATEGWEIVSSCKETQRGYDIVATQSSKNLTARIEAKGETSSKTHTQRYGKPFSVGQAESHVSRALYTAISNMEKGVVVGLAFPKNEAHLARVAAIAPALKNLGIEVFWVSVDRKVERDGNWGSGDGW